MTEVELPALSVLTRDRSDLVVDVSPYDCSPSLETK